MSILLFCLHRSSGTIPSKRPLCFCPCILLCPTNKIAYSVVIPHILLRQTGHSRRTKQEALLVFHFSHCREKSTNLQHWQASFLPLVLLLLHHKPLVPFHCLLHLPNQYLHVVLGQEGNAGVEA